MMIQNSDGTLTKKQFSLTPPLYVWAGDIWHNERDHTEFKADIAKREWVLGDLKVAFPPKTKVITTTPSL